MGTSDLDNLTEFEDYKLQICSFEHSNFQTKILNCAALARKFDQTLIGIFTKDSP
jgi:hypothetical protein